MGNRLSMLPMAMALARRGRLMESVWVEAAKGEISKRSRPVRKRYVRR